MTDLRLGRSYPRKVVEEEADRRNRDGNNVVWYARPSEVNPGEWVIQSRFKTREEEHPFLQTKAGKAARLLAKGLYLLALGGVALVVLYVLYLLELFPLIGAIVGGLLVLSLLSTMHSRVVVNSAEPAERHQLRAWAVAGFSLALSLGIGLLFISPLDSGNPPFDLDSDGTRPEMWADLWWVVLPLVVAPPLAWVAKKRLGWRSYVAAGALAPLAMAAFAYGIQDERRSQEQAVDVFTSSTGRLNGDPAIRFQVKDDVVVVCAPQMPGRRLLEKLGVFKDYSGFESCLRVVTSAPEGKQVEAGWRALPRAVGPVSDDRFDCFGDIDCGPPGVSQE